MREKECYRENLRILTEAFPNKQLVSVTDVARWSGVSRFCIKNRYFEDGKKFLTLPELASRLS